MKSLLTILTIVFAFAAFSSKAQDAAWNGKNAIQFIEEKPTVLIFPNPLVGQEFKVKSTEQPSRIVVINAIGQTVFSNEQLVYNFNNNYDVILEQPEKGLYLVRIDYLDRKSVVKKLLVK